jgi:hypothetical protein
LFDGESAPNVSSAEQPRDLPVIHRRPGAAQKTVGLTEMTQPQLVSQMIDIDAVLAHPHREQLVNGRTGNLSPRTST